MFLIRHVGAVNGVNITTGADMNADILALVG
jgi:hypothetical protein